MPSRRSVSASLEVDTVSVTSPNRCCPTAAPATYACGWVGGATSPTDTWTPNARAGWQPTSVLTPWGRCTTGVDSPSSPSPRSAHHWSIVP